MRMLAATRSTVACMSHWYLPPCISSYSARPENSNATRNRAIASPWRGNLADKADSRDHEVPTVRISPQRGRAHTTPLLHRRERTAAARAHFHVVGGERVVTQHSLASFVAQQRALTDRREAARAARRAA